MMAWDSLCTSKGMGGFDFKDLRLFNIAFLGRQCGGLSTIRILYIIVFYALIKALQTEFGWQISNGMTARFFKALIGLATGAGLGMKLLSMLLEIVLRPVRFFLLEGLTDVYLILLIRVVLIGSRTLLTYWILRRLRISSQFYGMYEMVTTMHCFRVKRMILDWFGSGPEPWGDDFRIFNLLHAPMNPSSPRSHRWIRPSNDAIKVNVDVAILDLVVGIGIIARDHDGFVLCGRVIILDYRMDVEWAEAEAMREGIILAHNNNITRSFFKTDCASLVNRFKFHREAISIFDFHLKEIFDLLDAFIDFKIEWVDRSSNRVADCLCKLNVNKHCTFPFNMDI
ncbi:hypothetical protein Gorai_004301 [Gossypium raimondii]|uniref:RNase H type-1 domain-containing protein n=1 Tax=Gossypium raimondii TaxID=29730 RepID=A0A7J8QHT5_GOSRA|nr:hypothetical protein [Gossypium raimondii]